MKKILGFFIIAALGLGIECMALQTMPFPQTLLVWIASVIFLGLIWLAVYLIED